jgi:serine protease Do
MLQRLPIRWGAPALLAGIAIGVALDSRPWTRPAHARGDARSVAAYAWPEPQGAALSDTSRQLARISAEVTPSVVHIESKFENPNRGLTEETGSGVIVTNLKVKGYFVVTNRHVVDDAADLNQVSVRLSDGRAFHPTKKWVDAETDLAVLKIESVTAKPATWGDSDRLEIGNLVLAVGSPFGLSQSVTLGIVSARGRALHLGKATTLVNQDFIQTDAAINFGNSGGPLIDINGQIVGINTAIASNSGGNDGIGFSIPSNLVRRVVNDLLERGQVRRAYLGVMLDPDFTADKARGLNLDRVRGAHILRVYPNSPASAANLLNDDVVLTFDGIEVQDENHLINLVSLTEIGRNVQLGVLRGGRRMNVQVHLSNRHEFDGQSEAPTKPGMGSLISPLGLTLHEVTPALAAQLGFAKTTRGLLVLSVDPKSSLAADIDVYDLLDEVGRTAVTTVADVQNALASEQGAGSRELLLRFKRRTGSGQGNRVIVWRR